MANYVPKSRSNFGDVMKLIHDEYERLCKKRRENPAYQPRNHRLWRAEFANGSAYKFLTMQGISPEEFEQRARRAFTTTIFTDPIPLVRLAGPFRTHDEFENYKFPEDLEGESNV